MSRVDLARLVMAFLAWRAALFLVAIIAGFLIPNFGGSFPYYGQVLQNTGLPAWVWGFGNFDGVHYLRIAQNGYDANYSQAFFPLYPMIMKVFTEMNFVFPRSALIDTRIYVDPSYFISGFLVSQIVFLVALVFVFKLFLLDFSKSVSFQAVVLLLCFPTAFYFGSVYSESLFLLFVVMSFYFLRKGRFLAAGSVALLASTTRLVGVLLVLPIIIEGLSYIKSVPLKIRDWVYVKLYFALCLCVIGLLFYMFFLRMNYNDPIYFLHSQPFFGANRSVDLVVFPIQVFYRYLKIFLSVPILSYTYFIAALEFICSLGVILLIALNLKRIRLSYLLFIIGVLTLPLLSGTLSSMPRYVLVAFPMLGIMVVSLKKKYLYVVAFLSILQAVLLSFFVRGYWIA